MKELWFTAFVLLLLGILVGMASLNQPTAAVVTDLEPNEAGQDYHAEDIKTVEKLSQASQNTNQSS